MMKKQTVHISNNINVLRAEKRITQEDLANAVGVTRATINAMEKASYNPSLELAFKVAQYFNKKIDDIFKFEVPDEKN